MASFTIEDLEQFRQKLIHEINLSPLIVEQFILLSNTNNQSDFKPILDESEILVDDVDARLIPEHQDFILELDSTEHNIRLFDNHQVHITDYTKNNNTLKSPYRNLLNTKQLTWITQIGDIFSDWVEKLHQDYK